MSKGILLEEYLKGGPETLSDSQLDMQLTGEFLGTPISSLAAAPEDLARSQTGVSQKTEQAIHEVFAQIESAQENAEAVDQAVKTASHGVKVLAPLLNAITRWVDPKSDPAAVEVIMGKVLGRVRRDSLVVAAAYGLSPADTPPWLTSQISGQIMELLVTAIDRNNGLVIESSDTSYLAPMLNLALEANGLANSSYGAPSTPSLQLINALTLASAEVMSEYHVFSYFHENPAEIAQIISDFLFERVIETTLDAMTERFNLNDNERAYFGTSLLRGAGRILADAWSKSASLALDHLKELPKDVRRNAVVSGYPLDTVFLEFEKAYQGLEISSVSAIRSLSPHRETPKKGASHAQRMG
ncbi:hypothetical protein ALQ64_03129 [Pseudomonas cannabina]|uniref:Uncharacterized protein n=1 Tax=Pseudomonas cannabina TaxID=86840 RepID=A0A3M3K479_PSECA|nr:hypothetical protein [Pseudomonas cannabina]RMN17145.1 hypothetical protein ALQ64_03129 [Pseudomonas cannabina]